MEFFDKIGKKASEAYKLTADKTGKIAKETKLKIKMSELKSQINDIYEEIGKEIYEKHVRKQDIRNSDVEELCTKIDVISDEIENLLQECLELKDKKQCIKCYTQIEKQDKYCRECGAKQTEDPPKEAEVLEELENTQVDEERIEEKNMVMDKLKEEIKGKNNEEEQNSDNQNIEEKNTKSEYSICDDDNNLEKTVRIESDVDIENEEEDD